MQLEAQIDDLRQQGFSEHEIRAEIGRQAEIEAAALSLLPVGRAFVWAGRAIGWAGRAIGIGRAATAGSFGAAKTFITSRFSVGEATSGRTRNFIGEGGRQGAERLFRTLTGIGNRGLDRARTVVGSLRDGTRVNIRTQTMRDGTQRTTVEMQGSRIGTRIRERIKVRFDEDP